MKALGVHQLFGLGILFGIEAGRRRLVIDHLARQHPVFKVQRPSLLHQRLRLRDRDAVEFGKLPDPAGFDHRPVRHRTLAFEVGRPVFTKIDITNVSPLSHRPLQLAVIKPEIFLFEAFLQFLGKPPVKHARRGLGQRNIRKPRKLFGLRGLLQIQDPGLLGLLSGRIDPAHEQPARHHASGFRIRIQAPFRQQAEHVVNRDLITFPENPGMMIEILFAGHGAHHDVPRRIEIRIILQHVIELRLFGRFKRPFFYLEHDRVRQ